MPIEHVLFLAVMNTQHYRSNVNSGNDVSVSKQYLRGKK
jgi:hypothetical protein